MNRTEQISGLDATTGNEYRANPSLPEGNTGTIRQEPWHQTVLLSSDGSLHMNLCKSLLVAEFASWPLELLMMNLI